MHWNDLFPLLAEVLDGDRALQFVEGIHKTDRFFRFSSFLETAAWCAKQMTQMGLTEVERLPLPADGKTASGDWVIPRAWDARSARLSLLDGTVLEDYARTPCSLLMYSAPTPPEGVTAELILVENPEDVLPDAVGGKLIVTGRPAKALVPLAVSGGACGIISDYFPLYPGVRNSREEMAGCNRWDNDFLVPVNETGLFGFSLSPENGQRVRELLKTGTVVGKAEVDTVFYEGSCETVSGAISGRYPEEPEILVYGHLYEPGANDNGSGCGLMLELARAITALIREGKLLRPRRTIRFVMGYECAGSMGYLHAHPERKAVCAGVADMVGTEEIDRTHLCLWHNPLSNWSFADVLLPAINKDYMGWRGMVHPYEEKPFTVGSDNIMGDPIFDIPTVAMITEPALSYHSSMDTPQRIDPQILKRNGIILGAFLVYTALAEEREVLSLLPLLQEQQSNTFSQDSILAARAHEKAIRSLKKLLPPYGSEKTALLLEAAAREVLVERIPPMPAEVAEMGGKAVYRRLVKGCLTFAGRPGLKDTPWQPAWNDSLNLPLFWTDGNRTLWEIAVLSAAEQNKELLAEWEMLREYFSFLQKQGYLEQINRT